MKKNLNYEILGNEKDGWCLNLLGAWCSEIAQVMVKENISSLLLKRSIGWCDSDLSFLSDVPYIRKLCLFAGDLLDLSLLNNLTQLDTLYLECPAAKIGPDFSALTRLKDLRVDWKPCYMSLFENENISYLHIQGFKEQDLRHLAQLTFLNDLVLIGGSINSLDGIQSLTKLSTVMLYQCTKLQSIGDIVNCNTLTEVRIESCKKITDMEKLLELTFIESLVLERSVNIKTIKGIGQFDKLRKLRVCDTSIVDGDMSELLVLKDVDIFFSNKKHYSHKLIEIKKANGTYSDWWDSDWD